jgi:hypothetical protein
MTTYRRITGLVTVAGAFALAATPAVAQPVRGYTGGSYVRQEKQLVGPIPASIPSAGSYVRQDKQLVGPSSASVSPTIVRLSPASGGFDWGDAGVGAAGGFALSMIAVGGVLAVTQRRGRRDQTVLSG